MLVLGRVRAHTDFFCWSKRLYQNVQLFIGNSYEFFTQAPIFFRLYVEMVILGVDPSGSQKTHTKNLSENSYKGGAPIGVKTTLLIGVITPLITGRCPPRSGINSPQLTVSPSEKCGLIRCSFRCCPEASHVNPGEPMYTQIYPMYIIYF